MGERMRLASESLEIEMCVSLCCLLVCLQHCEHDFINCIVIQIHLFLTNLFLDKETKMCVFILLAPAKPQSSINFTNKWRRKL